ncbi:hypothetical protein IJH16_01135 [Candidatus Saccharibacteria bacterium]|nr:hypothetical protein [Candidatus Saccharibacteria bacterium]
MNIRQVEEFFKDKKNTPCPLTERLIKAGYQQTGGGYIKIARERGVRVDYTKAEPTQYWHLVKEYCPSKNGSGTFSVPCGELIFWMAEVSDAVPKSDLEKLSNRIIASVIKAQPSSKPKYDRRKWNQEIRDICFDKIARIIEK